MGLFGKKDPCAICGGKVKGLFPSKIEDQYVCGECYGETDLPDGMERGMTLDQFRGYMSFRAENAQLKQQFQITQEVDFGWFDTKFVFDTGHRLLCMDKNLGKTIFEGSQIRGFTIKEDNNPIFEGSSAGLVRYASTVSERVAAMMPQIQLFRLQAELRRQKDDENRPQFDIPEPFKNFNVEIRFDHPYWSVFTADMSGPTFNNDMPNADDYLNEYNKDYAIMEQLARAFMQVAFPNAPEQTVQAGAGVVITTGAASSVPAMDAVEEIQRYKALMEQGVITEEEFVAKKRQLLGI